MRPVFYKLCAAILCLSLLLPFVPAASAALSGDITASTTVSGTGYDSFSFLTDGDQKNYRTSGNSASITLKNSSGMAGLYLLFDLEYGSYTITDVTTGQDFTAGNTVFLDVSHLALVKIDLAEVVKKCYDSKTFLRKGETVLVSEARSFCKIA